jgi:hypothetical protein
MVITAAHNAAFEMSTKSIDNTLTGEVRQSELIQALHNIARGERASTARSGRRRVKNENSSSHINIAVHLYMQNTNQAPLSISTLLKISNASEHLGVSQRLTMGNAKVQDTESGRILPLPSTSRSAAVVDADAGVSADNSGNLWSAAETSASRTRPLESTFAARSRRATSGQFVAKRSH